uniref:IclR family transcriptional regulator n=1 Tax=Aminobacter niigataensis TaxID=83265 RepID=UPI002852A4DE|nr:IclR family transcriptional regulator [Aminobacter niigataensis]WMD00100.1 IclR family transcriptional regulator [Aminobacter niigataensis]
MHSGGGPNAVEKVCAVLRAVSAKPGARLTELTGAAQLNKVTVARILETLCTEGFIVKTGKTYALGVEAIAMSASAARSKNLRAIARPSLQRLAQASEDTAQLAVRSGLDSVCIDREIGTYPLRNTYLEVGSRRPLGVGAGSLALLTFLSDEEVKLILDMIEPQLADFPRLSRPVIEDMIQVSRKRGYALSLDVILDKLGAISVPVRDRDGRVLCSISIAALSDRIRERETALFEMLKVEAQLLQLELK